MRRFLVVLIALVFSQGNAIAQSMLKSDMVAYANMRLNQSGEVEACGFEVNGAHITDSISSALMFSSSLMIVAQGYGTAKVVGKRGEIKEGGSFDLVDIPIYGAWFRTPGKPAAIPIAPLMEGENPAAKLYIAEFGPSVDVLMAIAQRHEIQVAVSYREGYQSIFFAIPMIEQLEIDQFFSCIDDLKKNKLIDSGTGN